MLLLQRMSYIVQIKFDFRLIFFSPTPVQGCHQDFKLPGKYNK